MSHSKLSAVPVVTALLIVVTVSAMVLPARRVRDPIRMYLSSGEEHLTLALSRDGAHSLNAKPITEGEIKIRLKDSLVERSPAVPILIVADAEASFAAVMAVMEDMRRLGIQEIGLVIDSWRAPDDVHSRLIAYRVFLSRLQAKEMWRARRDSEPFAPSHLRW